MRRCGRKVRLVAALKSEVSDMDARALHRFAIAPLPVPASWCAISLRLIAGLGFVEHGYDELSSGAEAFIGILHTIGMPFAAVLGWVRRGRGDLATNGFKMSTAGTLLTRFERAAVALRHNSLKTSLGWYIGFSINLER